MLSADYHCSCPLEMSAAANDESISMVRTEIPAAVRFVIVATDGLAGLVGSAYWDLEEEVGHAFLQC